MDVGKLYFSPRGFIYECVDKRVNELYDREEVMFRCWNPNDPRDFDILVTRYSDEYFVESLAEADTEYLESTVAMQKTSIRYHMREAQQKRDANIRFNKELKERRESGNR